MSGWNFDARQFEPSAGIEVWPAGKWPIMITASEEKPIKGDKPGFFWQFTIKGLDGPIKDKINFIRLNHKNASQQAMDIAHRTMSAICYATGVLQFQHPNQLHNIPFMCDVIVKRSDKVDADGNVVRGADGKPEQREQNEFNTFFNMAGVSAIDLAKGASPAGNAGGAQQPASGWGPQGGQPPQQQQQQQQQQPAAGGQWQGQPAAGGQWQGQPAAGGQQPQPPQGGQPGGGQAWQGQPQQPSQQGQQWQQQGQTPQQAQQPPNNGGQWQQQPPQGQPGQPAPWGPQGGQ